MQNKKVIIAELDFTQTFKMIAQAYQEIAVLKMRKIRSSVITTRQYLTELSEIFVDVKRARGEEIEQEKKNKRKPIHTKKTIPATKPVKPTQIGFTAPLPHEVVKKAQPAIILLSANTKLYGGIVSKVFKMFMKHIEKDTTSDIIIIGRLGRRLYQEYHLKKPYLYFEIPDTNVTIENLKAVMYHLVSYEKIYVYYGKFQTIATQDAAISNISGDQPFGVESEKPVQAVPTEGFLFEPTLDEVTKFFESLVSISLFKQTVYESELARLASRIMAMEEAQGNIGQSLRKLRSEEKKVKRLVEGKKQLERISGMSLWAKT